MTDTPPLPRTLTVMSVKQLTPNMRRICFGGPDLMDFPEHQESGYVKLFPEWQGKSVRRSYTVRRFDAQQKLLEIDFVLHGDAGPASAWAEAAEVGSQIKMTGPGTKKLVDFSADWFLIAGDMTALPAISVNVGQLSRDAKGYIAVEILAEEDKQEMQVPRGMELHWVVNPQARRDQFPLLDKVKQFAFLSGRPSMWVAGEFHTSRAIRQYLKMEKLVQREELYASSYWHLGLEDELHKVEKRKEFD